ncbi:MAG: hypothetical protein COS99_01900 [Candidatus Omnitrophica bacterium CG07_land_8_20_14_0_80_42_15]|uniref:Mce/MlaD domain-containing protein n=1 Tax=Candidatus Aquitaenariimonas noxiae TaxID=1974741 RepID=A0A2J0KWG4_9BACT|nr:MAG: hypothetical protein COS99_01900 [Candidatus Omnitrophica bacterium CG07_land_8_20_14_0_80_42_15]
MEGRAIELKVGIFIFIALIVLFIIIFSIGDFPMFDKTFAIKVKFSFVNGIEETAPVRLAGVDIGEVEKIDVYYDAAEKRTKVMLSARINKEVSVERDSVATINTLGLLGEKYLEITPGKAEGDFLKDGDTIAGEDPVSMETITKNMEIITKNVLKISDSATVVMDRLKEGKGTFGKLLVEEKIYNDLEAFVADLKSHPWKLLYKPRGQNEYGLQEQTKEQSRTQEKKSNKVNFR